MTVELLPTAPAATLFTVISNPRIKKAATGFQFDDLSYISRGEKHTGHTTTAVSLEETFRHFAEWAMGTPTYNAARHQLEFITWEDGGKSWAKCHWSTWKDEVTLHFLSCSGSSLLTVKFSKAAYLAAR